MMNFLTFKVFKPLFSFALMVACTFTLSNNAHAQINYFQDFENAGAGLAGWDATNGTGAVLFPVRVATAPCAGTGNLAYNQ
jgi:hypothetical protein